MEDKAFEDLMRLTDELEKAPDLTLEEMAKAGFIKLVDHGRLWTWWNRLMRRVKDGLSSFRSDQARTR